MQLVLRASGSQPRWHMARTRGREANQHARPGQTPKMHQGSAGSELPGLRNKRGTEGTYQDKAGHTTQATLNVGAGWSGGTPPKTWVGKGPPAFLSLWRLPISIEMASVI